MKEAVATTPKVKPVIKKHKVLATASAAVKTTTQNAQLSLSADDFAVCGNSHLLEVIETMHYKLNVCYEATTSQPTQLYKVDKFSGQSSSLGVLAYSHHDQGGTYHAEENGIAYIIDQANSASSRNQNLGTFTVKERGTTWVKESILKRTVVN